VFYRARPPGSRRASRRTFSFYSPKGTLTERDAKRGGLKAMKNGNEEQGSLF
jgi:hypothetical protein